MFMGEASFRNWRTRFIQRCSKCQRVESFNDICVSSTPFYLSRTFTMDPEVLRTIEAQISIRSNCRLAGPVLLLRKPEIHSSEAIFRVCILKCVVAMATTRCRRAAPKNYGPMYGHICRLHLNRFMGCLAGSLSPKLQVFLLVKCYKVSNESFQ